MSSPQSERLIWLDLEMTGLIPLKDYIIEIATVVTDWDLNIVATGPNLPIVCPQEALDTMDNWCTTTHTASGLLNRIASDGVDIRRAEELTLKFLREHVNPGYSPMCGNSIATDRTYMRLYMPGLEAFFHYRNLDVTVLKMLADKWNPSVSQNLSQERNHRALDDIHAAIDELKHFRQYFLKLESKE